MVGGWIEPDMSVSWPDQARDDKYFLRAPMISVEILSPREDMERKLTHYFAEGALEVWVLNRRYQSMVVYQRVGDTVVRRDVDEEYTCDPLRVTLRLADVFR